MSSDVFGRRIGGEVGDQERAGAIRAINCPPRLDAARNVRLGNLPPIARKRTDAVVAGHHGVSGGLSMSELSVASAMSASVVARVLVVEDDAILAELLAYNLKAEGFAAECVDTS